MEDIVDVVMQNPDSGVAIYASEDTQAQLGWITTELSDIVGVDTLVISRQDLYGTGPLPNLFEPNPDFVSSENRVRAALSETLAGLDMDPVLKQNYLDALDPNVAGIPGLESTMNSYVNAVVENAGDNSASAARIDLDFDGQTDLGVITTPNLHGTPESFIGTMTSVPEHMIENIPGDAEDYIAAIMFHEGGHVAQPHHMYDHNHGHQHDYTTNPVLFEADADAHMIRAFNNAAADGYDLDLAVLDVFEDARLAGGLQNTGLIAGQHMAAMLSEKGHNIELTSHSTGNLVDWENGLPTLPSESPLAELEAAATFQVNYMLGLYHVVELHEAVLGDVESMTEDEQQILKENLTDMSEVPTVAASNGAQYAMVHPGASLAALESLHEKGYLGEGSETYIGQVRSFFEDHAPDILETEDYARIQSKFAEFLPNFDEIAVAEAPDGQEPEYEPPAIAGQEFPSP